MKAEYLLGDTEMTNRYKSVFDIIGPIMVGQSSITFLFYPESAVLFTMRGLNQIKYQS